MGIVDRPIGISARPFSVIVVDINPAVVTKIANRGTGQAVGLVTDVELFLRALADANTVGKVLGALEVELRGLIGE